jgi:hypothetical protein
MVALSTSQGMLIFLALAAVVLGWWFAKGSQ